MPNFLNRNLLESYMGRYALVTGASSGLGEEFCRELAKNGTHLILVARDGIQLERLATELQRDHNIQVDCIPMDLTQPHAVESIYEHATAKGRQIHVLINNAGSASYRPFLNESWSTHDHVLRLNIDALARLTYLFSRHMQRHGQQSSILNVSSIAGFAGVENFALYAATKAFVLSFSEILTHEMRGTKITVSCLCPGGIRTQFSKRSGQSLTSLGDRSLMPPQKVAAAGLRGMGYAQAIIVPGLENKATVLLGRLLPRGFFLKLSSFLFQLAVKMDPVALPLAP